MLLRYLWKPYFLILWIHGIELFFKESCTIIECRAGGGGAMISKMKEEILEGNRKYSKKNKC